MPAIQFEIRVEMEDGNTWNVKGDQRDLAKYEVQPFYNPELRMTMTRFIAWSASVRNGLTKLKWPEFDAQCVEAGDVDDEDTELDPTKTDRSEEA